jgi:hypothetical protein
MAKHIKDIEQAWDLLTAWVDVSSRLNNDGMVMIKEMERLSIRTKRLIGDGINETSKYE